MVSELTGEQELRLEAMKAACGLIAPALEGVFRPKDDIELMRLLVVVADTMVRYVDGRLTVEKNEIVVGLGCGV